MLALALALAAACGVPVDPEPRALPAEDLPSGIFEQVTTTTQPSASGVEPTLTVDLYLVSRGRLVAVPRTVFEPATLGQVLGALLTGPADLEALAGLETAIDGRTRLLEASIEDGVAHLNLSEGFLNTPTQAQILALGQLVLTATQLGGVELVDLQLGGQPLRDVPTADGTLEADLLTRSDYEGLLSEEGLADLGAA